MKYVKVPFAGMIAFLLSGCAKLNSELQNNDKYSANL